MVRRPRLVLAAALLASGCASRAPLPVAATIAPIAPYQVAADAERHDGETILWGGMVIEVSNRAESSEIEILGYPLDKRQRPQLALPTEGRYIAVLPGYVESYEWPQGRFVTLTGRIVGSRQGLIQERKYIYPVVEVDQIHLWPQGFQHEGPKFSIGIGVGIHR